MTHQQCFVGIDIARDRLDIAIWPGGAQFSVANDRNGRAELVRKLKPWQIERIGLEASGGYERSVIRALLDAGQTVCRANPRRVRRFAQALGIEAKNDRLDALVIARFTASADLHSFTRDPLIERLAELVTARRQLCDDLTRAGNQADHVTEPVLQRLTKQRIDRLKLDIATLDKAIAELVRSDAQLAARSTLLRSVPGVGPVFAHTLLALMPELGSLSNRKIASLLGVAPFDDQSGRRNGHRHIFGGRQAVRDVAYMAALVAGVHNPHLRDFKQRLTQMGKQPKVVIVAIMRKLITILNAIVRDNSPWKHA